MTVIARKYNPGFLTDDELVELFCVRVGEFASLVEVLRACDGNANTHQIVIGPRGSGKTCLLLRVAVEVQRDAGLSSRFFPVVFAEESYEVATAGEFWLECLRRLAEQPGGGADGAGLRLTYEELRGVRDDRMLGERCLGTLQDFADRKGRRLLLIVENLNMMFGDMADGDAGWRLRQTLQTERRIVLLASATSRFDEIDDPECALYGLFRMLALRPLDDGECVELWRNVSRQDRARRTIRALRILTGGSPRLLTIMARFGAELSFRKLMTDLLDLVDDHTEHFKSHLEALPPQERRVYLALADLWRPATAAEVADRARLATSKVSAFLKRLTERGVVEVTGGTARRRLYYLSERLYNIYYLMRRSRGPDPLIEALIRFMEDYYSPIELKDFGARMAVEAADFDGETKLFYRAAFDRLVGLPSLAAHREELLSLALPLLPDWPSSSASHAGSGTAKELVQRGSRLEEEGRLPDALAAWDEVVQRFAESEAIYLRKAVSASLLNKAIALVGLVRVEEALAVYDGIVRRFGSDRDQVILEQVATALLNKGTALAGQNRLDEALPAWDECSRRFAASEVPAILDMVAMCLGNKVLALAALDRHDDALAVCDELVERFGAGSTEKQVGAVSKALLHKAAAFTRLDRHEDLLAVCDEIVKRFGRSDVPELQGVVAGALVYKSAALVRLDRIEEALAAADEVVRRFSDSEFPALHDRVEMALLTMAEIHLAEGQTREATNAAENVLAREGTGSPDNLFRAHLVRANIRFKAGDRSGSTADIEALLNFVPSLAFLPREVVGALSMFALQYGLTDMRDLIRSSPAAGALLPLTTALELELGLEPRVAKEVEEVAEDIRREMTRIRGRSAD